MKQILLFFFIGGMLVAKAQVATKNSARIFQNFHSFNTIQVLNGNTTTSLAVTTVNGFQFNRLFAGAGVGFDYYFHTTVPVFLEARFDLVKDKGKLQLFANGGLNFAFSAQNDRFEHRFGDYKTGSMYGAGLDYLAPVGKDAFIIGVAFNNKRVIHFSDNNIWNPVLNRVENVPLKEEYSFNRIAIRIGWMF